MSQPEVQADTTAEASTDETQPTPSAESVSSETDEDVAWLRTKGIDPSSPEAIRKAAQLARNTEREFHKTRQEAKQSIQAAVTEQEQETGNVDLYANPDLVAIQREVAEERFLRKNPEAESRLDDIIATAKEFPALARDFDLNTLWEITQARDAKKIAKEAEERGRKAEREAISRASAASLPSGNATTAGNTQATLTRADIANMDADEYMRRKPEIDRLAAEGRLK